MGSIPRHRFRFPGSFACVTNIQLCLSLYSLLYISPIHASQHFLTEAVFIAPAAGETIILGRQYNIRWTNIVPGENISLILVRAEPDVKLAVTATISNISSYGVFDWDVPSEIPPFLYKLQISDLESVLALSHPFNFRSEAEERRQKRQVSADIAAATLAPTATVTDETENTEVTSSTPAEETVVTDPKSTVDFGERSKNATGGIVKNLPLGKPVIIGASVGGVLFLVCAAVAVWLILRQQGVKAARHRRKLSTASAHPPSYGASQRQSKWKKWKIAIFGEKKEPEPTIPVELEIGLRWPAEVLNMIPSHRPSRQIARPVYD